MPEGGEGKSGPEDGGEDMYKGKGEDRGEDRGEDGGEDEPKPCGGKSTARKKATMGEFGPEESIIVDEAYVQVGLLVPSHRLSFLHSLPISHETTTLFATSTFVTSSLRHVSLSRDIV
ncbi:hypothetical protein FRC06_001990 [Ceratobasidium sp. 370]|nr:hypothetical protein FRC06_001990 [Ceratobasidium sp. 370]